MLSATEIAAIQGKLHLLSEAEQTELLDSLAELERRKWAKEAQEDLLAFCIAMDPNYKVGAHHKKLARLLTDMEQGKTDRIGVSVPQIGRAHV